MKKQKNVTITSINKQIQRKKASWLAGPLSLAVLVSGGLASASVALAASPSEQPSTVTAASYDSTVSYDKSVTLDSSTTDSTSVSNDKSAAADTIAPLPAGPLAGGPQPGLEAPAPGLPPLPGLPPMAGGLDSTTLLTALNMSQDQLRTALESGQSLYDIAAAQGADVQQIVGLATTALKSVLERELSDDRITTAQYESRLNEAAARAEASLKRTHPKPPTPGQEPAATPAGWGPAMGPGLEQIDSDKLLSVLGIGQEELAELLQSGQSLADIADARSIDRQQLADLAARAMYAHLDQELSEKMIWTDEYEARKQDVPNRALDAIQHKHPHPPISSN